jgi:hypothetical protein
MWQGVLPMTLPGMSPVRDSANKNEINKLFSRVVRCGYSPIFADWLHFVARVRIFAKI